MYTRHALAAGLLSVALAACLVPVGPEPEAIREEGEPGVIGQEIARTIDCKGLTPEACSARCAEEGLHCISRRFHPTNKALPKGELIKCGTTFPERCAYRFSSGETCYFFSAFRKPLCVHTGG